MNSVIRSIRTPRTSMTSDRIETTQKKITVALLSNESVFDGEATHTFEDALQYLWASDSSAESIDAELKKIACGESDSLDPLKKILTHATDKYAEKIAEKVALHDLEDGINTFVESLDAEEFQSFRGRV
jgi:hypothetical protein